MNRIINFSGGRTSAMMTILYFNPLTDYVIFCDTGREHPKTYKFINDFEAHEKIPIIRLGGKDAFDNFLQKTDYKDLPFLLRRKCTTELKVKPARRWARENIGMRYYNLIGFRADEKNRVLKYKNQWQKVINKFPLYEKNFTKQDVDDFWKIKPYNLEIPHILGNCTLCFLKGKNNIINILKHDPSLAEPWIKDEKEAARHFGHTYIQGTTIEQFLKISQMPDLFNNIDLNDLSPSFNCSCTA